MTEEGGMPIGLLLWGVLLTFGGVIAGGLGAGLFEYVLLVPGGILFLLGAGRILAFGNELLQPETRVSYVGTVAGRPPREPSPNLNPDSIEADVPLDVDLARELSPAAFQSVMVHKLGGTSVKKRSRDMGVDGYLPDGTPIQVKRSERISRNRLDEFETATRRAKSAKGIFVALSFSPGTRREAARALEEEGLDIRLVTVQELIDGWADN
jgi:hypothetical protein